MQIRSLSDADAVVWPLARTLFVFVIAFVLAACAASSPTVESQKFDYDALIRETQAAFGNRDVDTAVEVFADDGVVYRVTEAGAV
ncbi:MAG: hypothetical protein FJX59_16835 [Alphaproteobacteria bacterium]|nr:hypothetical protein [Alphaproteobacteria bacterium]